MKYFVRKISIVFLMLLLCMSLSAKSRKTITKKVKKNARGTSEKTVQAPEYPKAIVTLSPSAAEILYAIGAQDQIVAVSEFTDYPPEAAEKPVVGGFDGKTLSIETIISYEPDFVYLTEGMHNFLIDSLNAYGENDKGWKKVGSNMSIEEKFDILGWKKVVKKLIESATSNSISLAA